MFSVLTNTSIASMKTDFTFLMLEKYEERETERQKWTNYVKEMSVFYFDIFVDYIQALLQQGIYTPEDAMVFSSVMGKNYYI